MRSSDAHVFPPGVPSPHESDSVLLLQMLFGDASHLYIIEDQLGESGAHSRLNGPSVPNVLALYRRAHREIAKAVGVAVAGEQR